MRERPTVEQLLDAVCEFIGRQLLPTVGDPVLRYRTMICANLLAQVRAEITYQPDLAISENRGLDSLIGPGDGSIAERNAELARRIRDRDIADEDLDAVREHLLELWRGYLAVVHPRFDTRLDIEQSASGE